MPSIRFEPQCTTPKALVIMFHGVGSSPKSLRPLAEYLHQHCREIEIRVSVGFSPSPLNPKGFHWFDITDITEENRLGRVLDVMPAFDQLIRKEAQDAGVPLNKVILLGFSQGTIMSLEWFKQSRDTVAGIVGIAGRFAELPKQTLQCNAPICLIHGEQDSISDPAHAQQSYDRLSALNIKTELNLLADTGHKVTAAMHLLCRDFIQRHI